MVTHIGMNPCQTPWKIGRSFAAPKFLQQAAFSKGSYTGCKDNATVELIQMANSGHQWQGAPYHSRRALKIEKLAQSVWSGTLEPTKRQIRVSFLDWFLSRVLEIHSRHSGSAMQQWQCQCRLEVTGNVRGRVHSWGLQSTTISGHIKAYHKWRILWKQLVLFYSFVIRTPIPWHWTKAHGNEGECGCESFDLKLLCSASTTWLHKSQLVSDSPVWCDRSWIPIRCETLSKFSPIARRYSWSLPRLEIDNRETWLPNDAVF